MPALSPTLCFFVVLSFSFSFKYVFAYADIAKILEIQRAARATGSIIPFPEIGGIPRVPGTVPFNPQKQLVSVHGDHEWIAPGPDSQRGPCPGLNAAANHNYIPRDGVATYAAVQTGLWEAYGLDQIVTELLQQTATLFDGDPFTKKWSIGGYSPKTAVLGGVLSFLGKESGICAYGHSKGENDASATRGDFLSPEPENSNCRSYPKLFQQLLDLACETNNCNISMATLARHQHNRKLHSITNNPSYFSPAFGGVVFTPAAHHLVFALMANRSDEHPQGLLTPSTLMQFFSYGYEADGKTLKYTYGHERIPENFYKRAVTDPWTLADVVTGVVQQCLAYPSTCAVGGNTGTVNSFAGVEVGNITGGVFDATAFTDPEKLGCFISQNIQAEAPSFLSNVFQGPLLQEALELLTSELVPTLAKGFGACNGINVKGGNGGKNALPRSKWASRFPGSVVRTDGPRALSPSP